MIIKRGMTIKRPQTDGKPARVLPLRDANALLPFLLIRVGLAQERERIDQLMRTRRESTQLEQRCQNSSSTGFDDSARVFETADRYVLPVLCLTEHHTRMMDQARLRYERQTRSLTGDAFGRARHLPFWKVWTRGLDACPQGGLEQHETKQYTAHVEVLGPRQVEDVMTFSTSRAGSHARSNLRMALH